MKLKVKFDLGSIKAWLLEHGEKLALGLVAVVFLMFTWSAITREVLPDANQPDKLQQVAREVQNHVRDSTWDEKAAGVEIVDYEARVKREPVLATAFEIKIPMNPLLADPKSKRDNPKVFPLEEPRIAAGFGTFALRDVAGGAAEPRGGAGAGRAGHQGHGVVPGAAAKLKGQSWIVVTALVPKLKQESEYSRAFDGAMGGIPERDTVEYVGYYIQRAEVSDSDPAKLEWKPMPSAEAFQNQWEAFAEEIVPKEYIDPTLTTQLGPLVGIDWDESVSHPKIPLESPGDVAAQPPQQAPPVAAAPVAAAAPNDGRVLGRARPPVAPKPGAPPAAVVPGAVAKAPIEYRLFRVFDFSVEPKKKYRYQVRLVLRNPNLEVRPQYLKDPEVRTQKELMTDWSEPTPIAVVPDGYRVFGGVVVRRLPEPEAKVLISSADEKEGIEAAAEVPVQRGSVAASSVKPVLARDPRTNQTRELENVNFRTDRVVVDIRGGKPLSRIKDSGFNSPGEVLLVDPSGNLTVRSELEDQLVYETRKPPEAEVEKPKEKTQSPIIGGGPSKGKKKGR